MMTPAATMMTSHARAAAGEVWLLIRSVIAPCGWKTSVLFRALPSQTAVEERRFMKRLGSPTLASDNRSNAHVSSQAPIPGRARRAIYHLMVPMALALLSPLSLLTAGRAFGQGQELAPIKVDLPPTP